MTLEIRATATYSGANPYAQHAVAQFALGEPGQQLPRVSRDALVALHEMLPGLREHSGSCGAPACFDPDGADLDAGVGHLFEHVCIELQNFAGVGLSCVRAQALADIGAECAAVPYEDDEICVAAARLAGELLAGVAPAQVAPVPALAQKIDEFRHFTDKRSLPAQDRALIKTARALDVPVTTLAGRILVLGQGRFQRRLSATHTSLTSAAGAQLAANKDYAHRVLGDAGLPMPRYARVYSAREAAAAARRIGYPVVVKPNADSMGAGVSVGMKNRREVSVAYRRARQSGRSALVEELVEGNDYRMLVIDGRLRAAARRIPAHVVGDGVHNIEELVAEVNRDPRRGNDHDCPMTRIELDDQTDQLIAERGYTRLSVPEAGEIVNLRRNANISCGGTATDVTDKVHPDNRDIAERAARAIGLDIAGVDFLTRDISRSMWKTGGRICEINSRPDVRMHLWPAVGKTRDVLTPIIDMLFPRGQPARIPIVAFTGTGDTTTAAQLLAHVLSTAAGRRVGLSAAGRVWSCGKQVGNAGLAAPAATRMVLFDPDADIAVLEIRPDDVLRVGLGCDAITLTMVVDPGPAAAGLQSEGPESPRLIDAIRVVARSTREAIYAGHADPCAAAIERDGGSAELCRVFAGAARKRPARGRSLVQDGGSVVLFDGGRERGRVPLAEALPGLPAPSAQAAVYAVAAACHLGIEPKEIFGSLRSFRPLPQRAVAASQPRMRRSRSA